MDGTDAPTPVSSPHETAGRRDLRSRIRSVATDPARCFLVVGALAGLLLVFVIPPLAGIDEPAHFVRAYQISTGRLVPQVPPGATDGAGACIPNEMASDLGRLILAEYLHVNDVQNTTPDRSGLAGSSGADRPAPSVGIRAGCPAGERFVDFSAFGWYSPISYVPQALAVAVGRGVGVDTRGLVLLARLAGLAAYLALVFVAIRRSPFARWGLCAVGLLPVALFQAASSRSPDAVTIGVGMLVLGAALRAAQGGTSAADGGSALGERLALCALLGALKPTYAVLSLCFLLPLWARPRPERLRTMLAPVAAAFGTSTLWQSFAGHYFVCDTRYFGWDPRTGDQIDTILHSPLRYALAVVESFGTYGGRWLDQAMTVGITVANWAWPGIAVAIVAYFVAAARRDPKEVFQLGASQRALLLGIVLTGMVLVITGEHVYCAPVGLDLVYPPHARHFLPVLPLLAVALTPSRPGRARSSRSDRIPSAPILLLVTLAFVVSTALEMR